MTVKNSRGMMTAQAQLTSASLWAAGKLRGNYLMARKSLHTLPSAWSASIRASQLDQWAQRALSRLSWLKAVAQPQGETLQCSLAAAGCPVVLQILRRMHFGSVIWNTAAQEMPVDPKGNPSCSLVHKAGHCLPLEVDISSFDWREPWSALTPKCSSQFSMKVK